MGRKTARYSPVAPLPLLERMFVEGLLDGYLLVLAHDVLDKPEGYRRLVKAMREGTHPGNVTIILDNSAIELPEPLKPDELKDACRVVMPTYIVMPDALEDMRKTIDLVQAALDAKLHNYAAPMFVPQGESLGQLFSCADILHSMWTDICMVQTTPAWGIPRWVANEFQTRGTLVDYIATAHPGPIHMLGMSKNIRDDIETTLSHDCIMGIDSANPVVLGQRGHALNFENYQHLPRAKFWDETWLTDMSKQNIQMVRGWLEAAR